MCSNCLQSCFSHTTSVPPILTMQHVLENQHRAQDCRSVSGTRQKGTYQQQGIKSVSLWWPEWQIRSGRKGKKCIRAGVSEWSHSAHRSTSWDCFHATWIFKNFQLMEKRPPTYSYVEGEARKESVWKQTKYKILRWITLNTISSYKNEVWAKPQDTTRKTQLRF